MSRRQGGKRQGADLGGSTIHVLGSELLDRPPGAGLIDLALGHGWVLILGLMLDLLLLLLLLLVGLLLLEQRVVRKAGEHGVLVHAICH